MHVRDGAEEHGSGVEPKSELETNGDSLGFDDRGSLKTELQSQLCNSFGLTVTVAHYPTSVSKWNSIEHRLFSEISKKLDRRASR